MGPGDDSGLEDAPEDGPDWGAAAVEAGAAPLSDAAGAEGELSGRIDHSPPSRDFRPGQVIQIGRLAQLDSAVERYVSEHDFSGAHPGWLG